MLARPMREPRARIILRHAHAPANNLLRSLLRLACRPRPLLLILSAPSGTGKTAVCRKLLKREPWLRRCVTATTRPPRQGERHGRDYWFLSEGDFRRRIRRGGFYEWARVHGRLYGTPRREVQRNMRRGQSLVLVIDVQGGLKVQRRHPQAVLVFLLPPSWRALQHRLLSRNQDSAPELKRRLQGARAELRCAEKYDYLVLNQALDEAAQRLSEIVQMERWRIPRQKRR